MFIHPTHEQHQADKSIGKVVSLTKVEIHELAKVETDMKIEQIEERRTFLFNVFEKLAADD